MNPDLGDDGNIRHYTLTFVGIKFVFWILQPSFGGSCSNGMYYPEAYGTKCTDARIGQFDQRVLPLRVFRARPELREGHHNGLEAGGRVRSGFSLDYFNIESQRKIEEKNQQHRLIIEFIKSEE